MTSIYGGDPSYESTATDVIPPKRKKEPTIEKGMLWYLENEPDFAQFYALVKQADMTTVFDSPKKRTLFVPLIPSRVRNARETVENAMVNSLIDLDTVQSRRVIVYTNRPPNKRNLVYESGLHFVDGQLIRRRIKTRNGWIYAY